MTTRADPERELADGFFDRYRLAALIQAIEDDLRGFIREYIAPYVEANTLFSNRVEEMRRRASLDGVLDASTAALVDYADFGDAFAILNRHRGMVPEALATAVRALTPAFETAVPIRNRVMHGRPLGAGDEEHVARLGQSLVELDAEFPLTRTVVAHLVSDPSWTPAVEISSTEYGNILHNLPLPEFDETGLLGREDELREVTNLLLGGRFPVVTIAGEGGIGKTALAVQALYDIVDASESPYEAVLWASLKTERLTGRGVQQIRDAGFDLMSITAELSSAIGESTDNDVALLAQLLDGTPALVAIDNVESIGATEIRNLIAALPDCRFLLTSRVGLGEIEWRVPLGALGPIAAKIMMRQLDKRRGLQQLARMSDQQAGKAVEALRRSPLAIRWFVEAVHAGGQPDDLLRDQSAVLQFCMATIYDSLGPEGRKVVDCLLALDAPAAVGQLALLTDLDRDEVLEQIYELQRRAVVNVDTKLSESLSQSYVLSDMARQYLERFGSLDTAFSERVKRQLREIAANEEIMRRFDERVALEPMAIAAGTPEERAVAHVLHAALRKSRAGDIDGARELVGRGRDAAPGYFESYRVGAFIESGVRPEEARRQYAEAYRLAPEQHRPKVAYWLAGHLMKNLMTPHEAEPYAREAYNALRLPPTALRLGRVLMYEERYDEAEELLAAGAATDHGKTRAIAETDLLDLAKRRVERAEAFERQPAQALRCALDGLRRGWTFLASGVTDRRFSEALAELLGEALLVALRAPDVKVVEDELVELLESIDKHFAAVARPGLRELWQPRLARFCARRDCPPDIGLYGEKLEARLNLQAARVKEGEEAGTILEFSAKKGYGFVRPLDGGQGVFFHKTLVADPRDCFLLVRGTEVTYFPREALHNGEMRFRAERVRPVATELERERALRRRRGAVVHRTETYVFIEDIPTQERVYVSRSAFRDGAEWPHVRVGTVVRFDVDFNAQGAKAAAGSVAVDDDDT